MHSCPHRPPTRVPAWQLQRTCPAQASPSPRILGGAGRAAAGERPRGPRAWALLRRRREEAEAEPLGQSAGCRFPPGTSLSPCPAPGPPDPPHWEEEEDRAAEGTGGAVGDALAPTAAPSAVAEGGDTPASAAPLSASVWGGTLHTGVLVWSPVPCPRQRPSEPAPGPRAGVTSGAEGSWGGGPAPP